MLKAKHSHSLSHHVNTLLVIQHQSVLSLTGANNKTTEVFKSWESKPLKPQKQDNCLVVLNYKIINSINKKAADKTDRSILR